MESIGKNSTIKVGRRKLHVQTALSEEKNGAVASVFESGRLIFKREVQFANDLSHKTLREEVDQFHQVVMADLELLFYIAEKVKNIDHAYSKSELGKLFLHKNLFEEAIEEFRLATELEPDKAEHYLDLGKAHYLKGDFEEAVKWFKVAAEHAPVYADIRFALGCALWKSSHFYEARQELLRATEFNEKYHQAYYALGLVLIDSAESNPKDNRLEPPIERIHQGCDYIRRAMSLSEEYNLHRVEAGIALLDQKKIREALTEFIAANYKFGLRVEEASDSEFFLKFMFGGLGKDDQMVDDYIATMQMASSENPDYADIRHNLGVAYLIKGRNMFLQAIKEFRKAVKINPHYEKAKKSLRLVENDGMGLLILLRAILK